MQAVVITAYRDSEQTYKLAEYLSQKFIVYIHFDESDYVKIKSGDYFFMRKVRMPISEELVEMFK